jgi:tRNA(adenine34) deaminase
MNNDTDIVFMKGALAEAIRAKENNEVPVGAVIVLNGKIIGRGCNRRESLQDATAHAEIFAIREACSCLKSFRLDGCTLYVTLEPCPMCAGAAVNARIDRIVFGCRDPKAGSIVTLYNIGFDGKLNHAFSITENVLEKECRDLLKNFFKNLR